MKTRTVYAVAFLAAIFAAAGIGHATRATSASKLQVIYRAQAPGEWQVYLFGVDPCAHGNMQVIYPKDPATQPLEIECDLK